MKFVIFSCFLLTLALSGCIDNSANSPYPDISFSKKTSLPGVGRASAVGFAIDGKGYVALGRSG